MSLDRYVSVLVRLPILSAFEPEALRLIAFAAEPVRYSAGDVVFRAGEPSDGGLLVLSGLIMLDPGHGSMDESKIVGPGALIGELALFTQTIHPATAITRETAAALKIPRTLTTRVLQEFPQSAVRAREALRQQIEGFGASLGKARKAF